MSAKKIAVAVTVVCVLVMAIFLLRPGISTNAQAPAGTRTLPYAGQLANSDQAAVDGAYDLTFSLYDAPAAGNLLWSEKQTGVAVSGGKFSTDLGVAIALPASLFELKEAWLEVSLRGPGETDFTTLSPRQLFTPDSPLSIDALTCPHSHFTDSWTGTSSSRGLVVDNIGTGDGARFYTASTATTYAAVYAINDAASGVGNGVYARSAYGPGILVTSTYNDGLEATTSALLASNKSAIYAHSVNGNGVYAVSTNRNGIFAYSGTNDGIDATTNAPFASAMSAIYAHSIDGNGVWGISTNRYGVTGISTNSFGVVAAGPDATAADWLGDLWLDGDPITGRGEILTSRRLNLQSNWNVNVEIDHDANETDARFRVFADISHEVFSVDELGNVYADGGWVPYKLTDNYGERQLYGTAATEARFEDFGSAVLLKGVTTIAFDPIFAETINTNVDYQVFLTPVCKEPVVLFVTVKTPTGFTVQGVTFNNEPSNCSFDYLITAKRLGSENLRLDQMSTPSDVPTQ